jgi:hypothetical protein
MKQQREMIFAVYVFSRSAVLLTVKPINRHDAWRRYFPRPPVCFTFQR